MIRDFRRRFLPLPLCGQGHREEKQGNEAKSSHLSLQGMRSYASLSERHQFPSGPLAMLVLLANHCAGCRISFCTRQFNSSAA